MLVAWDGSHKRPGPIKPLNKCAPAFISRMKSPVEGLSISRCAKGAIPLAESLGMCQRQQPSCDAATQQRMRQTRARSDTALIMADRDRARPCYTSAAPNWPRRIALHLHRAGLPLPTTCPYHGDRTKSTLSLKIEKNRSL